MQKEFSQAVAVVPYSQRSENFYKNAKIKGILFKNSNLKMI